ncbi:MAG: hypothetical protein JNK17_06775 [Hydrogenophaga sp.]|nr:hypothetical protein [Hydrogenophaga sp.]
MLHRLQCDIVRMAGEKIGSLLTDMQNEDELFESAATLHAVEAQLLVMSQTLAHLAPELHARLNRIDWQGWGQLHHLLETDGPSRREAVWYGVRSLVPATLELIADLRKREPLWFQIDY